MEVFEIETERLKLRQFRVEDAQEELDRLMTAGKDKGSIKSKITEAVKEEYLAGSDGDREKLEKKLLALEDADGNPLQRCPQGRWACDRRDLADGCRACRARLGAGH